MYTKVGFVKVPHHIQMVQSAIAIKEAFGQTMDIELGKALDTLSGSRDNFRLAHLFFTSLLRVEHPLLVSGSQRKAFLYFVSHILYEMGYVEAAPITVDYRINPVLSFDEVLDRMLVAWMPKFEKKDIGGDQATMGTLKASLPIIVRKYAEVERYRLSLAFNFRLWLGTLGYQLLTGKTLSQSELTALVLYGDTFSRYGASARSNIPSKVIKAVENRDPIVLDVAQKYVAGESTGMLPGPSINHSFLVRDGTLEQLYMYSGIIVPELPLNIGFRDEYAPFTSFEYKERDKITWGQQQQLLGINSRVSQILLTESPSEPFGLRLPVWRRQAVKKGTGIDISVPLIPDTTELTFELTTEDDVSAFNYSFFSTWRGRTMSTRTYDDVYQYYLFDKAIQKEQTGAVNIESIVIPEKTLLSLTPQAETKVYLADTRKVLETFLLPDDNGVLRETDVDMTAHYTMFGAILFSPAFGEFLEVEQGWFESLQPDVVDYIASLRGLTIIQKKLLTYVISLYSNANRYKRFTNQNPSISVASLAFSKLGQVMPPDFMSKFAPDAGKTKK